MRLLRLLSNLGYGSRKQLKVLFREGRVTDVRGRVLRMDEACAHAEIRLDGEPLDPPQGMLIAMHKPVGYACSHRDAGPLVHDLLPARFGLRRPVVSSAGRLDRDTSGLLLLTDDGALLHRIIAPRRHVPKVYLATLADTLRGDEAARFTAGDLMLKGERTPLAPAGFEAVDTHIARVTLTEGRYHQVRRMFAACGHHVTALQRVAVGALELQALALAAGQWRRLDAREVGLIFAGS